MASCVLCRCCLAVIVLCCTALQAVDSFSLRIPQHQMHQILPLGTNATVYCLPEPNGSRPVTRWTIDGSFSYDVYTEFYNNKGIKVHLTADNISVVFVEGRQENVVEGGIRFLCSAMNPESSNLIDSDTAVVEFYGPPTAPSELTVSTASSLSLLLSWEPSQGRNISYELTASRTDAVNSDSNDDPIELTATSHEFNVSSMERCKEYRFTVRAVNPAGNSNESDAITAVIPDGPGEMAGLEVTVHIADNTTSVLIKFSPTQCGSYPTNYTLRLTDQDNNTLLFPLNVTPYSMSLVSAEIKTLPIDTNFTAVVIASNAFGSSQSQPASIYTTEVQHAIIHLFPGSPTANITCHFAQGSNSKGCVVAITRGSTAPRMIKIPREIGSLVARKVIQLPSIPSGQDLVFAVYSNSSDGMLSTISVPVRVETSSHPSTTIKPPGTPSSPTRSSTTSASSPSTTIGDNATSGRQSAIDVHLILITVVPVGVTVLLLVLVMLLVMILGRVYYRRKHRKHDMNKSSRHHRSSSSSEDTSNRSIDTGYVDNCYKYADMFGVAPYEVVPVRNSIHKPQDPIYQEIGVNGGLTPLALLSPSPVHTSTDSSSPPPLPPPYQPSPPTSPRPTTARHSLPLPGTCTPRDSFLPRSDSSGNSTSCSSQSTVTTPLTPGGDHLYFTLDQAAAACTSQQIRETVGGVEYSVVIPLSKRRPTSADNTRASRRMRRTSDSALEVTSAASHHHANQRLKKSASLKRTWV